MTKSRTVAIAIDGSSSANYAFRWACENFVRADDRVVMIHVTKDYHELEPDATKGQWTEEAIVEYQRKVEEQARILTSQYTHKLLGDRIEHEAVIIRGDARKVLAAECERLKPAALILGSRGLGVVKRSLLGSVSDHCVHNCPCAVIVVKE